MGDQSSRNLIVYCTQHVSPFTISSRHLYEAMEDDGEGGNNNAPSSSSSAQLLPVSSSAGNANGSSSRGPAAAVEMVPLLVLGAGVVAPRRGSNGNDLENGGGRKVRVQWCGGGRGALRS